MWIRPLAAIDAHWLVRTVADPMSVAAAIDGEPALFGSGAAVAGRRRARSSGVPLGFLQLGLFFLRPPTDEEWVYSVLYGDFPCLEP